MVNFNNSIMIRNHAGSSVVKDTAKLIETLKKVGIIKTKKRRARRSLAKDEIRQDSDMGPGYAETISMPPQFGASPQQQDYNAQRIEDIQRQSSNQIALLRSHLRQIQEQDTNRFGLQQRIENAPPKITQPESIMIDTNEFEGSNSGAQPDRGSGAKLDFDEETATGIFVGDEPVATAAAELTNDDKVQKVIEAFNHSPIPNTVKALKEYIKSVAEADGVMLGISGTKDQLMNRIKSYYLSKYEGLPY